VDENELDLKTDLCSTSANSVLP